MTEPTVQDQKDGFRVAAQLGPTVSSPENGVLIAQAIAEARASCPNLPPLFEADDWLWVAQSLGYVGWSDNADGFEARHRMDRIIARILEYRAEDVRKKRKCPG